MFEENVFSYENTQTVVGLTDALLGEYISNYFFNNKKNILVVADSLYDANLIYKIIHYKSDNVFLFPMDEFITLSSISSSPDLKVTRIDTLNQIVDKKSIVITNLTGFLKKVDKGIKEFNLNKKVKRNEVIKFLEENSFNKTNLVTATGDYAVRSFIIDIFSINYNEPIRIEFFGDDIESIRFFDADTQVSKKEVESVLLYSFSDCQGSNSTNIYDRLDNPMVFFLNYKKILADYSNYKSNMGLFKDQDELLFVDFNITNIKDKIYINSLDDTPIENKLIRYESKNVQSFNSNFEQLKNYVNVNIKDKIVVFMIKNPILREKIIELFDSRIKLNKVEFGYVNIIDKSIISGFIFDNYIVISEYDIENTDKTIKFINRYNVGRKIKGFDDLKKGDFVVHVTHGIGQYQGITTLVNKGIKKDYILINYAGNDKIYVPAHKIETIYKYADNDVSAPKLNNLNSLIWQKTKSKVQSKIKDISEELIKLYAEREMTKGESYADFPEEEIFASEFEYEETVDQSKCIKEILKDLNSSIPMDRLLCGDVGFGKTEVAMRAMFKTVINNRQVAYLCPTTILSKQQYESCKKRFRHFAVNIELLNRFTSTKDFNRIIEGIMNGTIDIVIGTHRLLNEKVKFKHLGLLVIDEEQRFGVSQKERIKELRKNVNVLSLSATPIPRTLKLAMSGLKDMSVIDTPPINRYPIQTYVIEENDNLIKEAIYKELSRDGQVYILNNNIEQLPEIQTKIKQMIPEAKIAIVHGQMEKDLLNNVINDFINREYNILLCTTIIETGIDISNVNTLIVQNAELFGLSQLYQIRGRVGRSDKVAYAYLMYKKDKLLNDIAIKRLKSIKEFTELGSGYKIAMRDLSIRGAGELLGSSQSGFVDSVGIELYMQMINNEVKRLKGEEVIEDNANENSFLDVNTSISKDYVEDESLRIEIHKLINEIDSKESYIRVKDEIEDRFGKINNEIQNYMYEEWFQKEAEQLGINNIRYLYNDVEIQFPENISSKVDGEKLFLKLYSINPKFKIKYFNKMIVISLNIINRNNDYVKDLLDLLELIKDCIK